MSTTIIDSHAHLDWDSFKEDQTAVIQRALDAGVVQIVQAGVYLHAIADQIALAERYDFIYCGIGLHPHEAKDWNADSADILTEWASHPKVVAIGECGLDFHYNHSEPDAQRAVFAEQVRIARKVAKPLIIHTREAWDDTFDIIKREGKGEVPGVFHCFTGSPEVIPTIKEIDYYVSFSGIVTFPKSADIQAAAPLVSADRLMVETDSPYLAPQGMRGKRNEPANVWLVAEKIATLRGVSREQIADLTKANARRLFGLPEISQS